MVEEAVNRYNFGIGRKEGEEEKKAKETLESSRRGRGGGGMRSRSFGRADDDDEGERGGEQRWKKSEKRRNLSSREEEKEEEVKCQFHGSRGRRKKVSVVGEMLSRRNVYQVSSPGDRSHSEDPRLYCQCPLHKKQRENMQNNNYGGGGGGGGGKLFTSWLSNIQLSRVPPSRTPSARESSSQSHSRSPGSTLRSSKSLKGERPPLSLEYNSSRRFTGSSGQIYDDSGGVGGDGGGVGIGVGSDVSRPQVRLQGITRRGTMYPMRTSVSSTEFAAASLGLRRRHFQQQQESFGLTLPPEVLKESGKKPPLRAGSAEDDSNVNSSSSGPVNLRKNSNPASATTSSPSSTSVGGGGKKQCRVLFSYAPAHEDELELKVDDVIEFLGEVEDGWWRGHIKGAVGVFPSNFVEMMASGGGGGGSGSPGRPPLSSDNKTVVDNKNKKNENITVEGRVRAPSKISSLIQEAEAKSKSKSNEALGSSGVGLGVGINHNRKRNNSSTENVNPRGSSSSPAPTRQSPLGRELMRAGGGSGGEAKSSSPSSSSSGMAKKASGVSEAAKNGAPKLPPKPVKEQCIVLFPYTALNEDELSLSEGQVINIVTKEVEDKGWWKGEVDGRVGVFPDNFVKLIVPHAGGAGGGSSNSASASTSSHGKISHDEVSSSKSKRPLRPPNSPAVAALKESSKASKGGSASVNSSKDLFASSGNKRGSLVSEETNKASSSKDRLGISTPFGGRAGSVKVPLGGSSGFNKEPKRMSSRDNMSNESGTRSLMSGSTTSSGSSSLSSSAAGKRQSSFRTNPPPKPKPPPALSKPTSNSSSSLLHPQGSTESSSKSNHLTSTTSFTAKLSSKFGGGGSRVPATSSSSFPTAGPDSSANTSSSTANSPLSAGGDNQRTNVAAAVTASASAAATTEAAETALDFDSVEAGERLTHPTAGRAKAPKRRPPSSVFVKESKSHSDVFNFSAPSTTSSAAVFTDDDDLPKETAAMAIAAALSKSLEDVAGGKDRFHRGSVDHLPAHKLEASKGRLSFKLVRQVKDVFGGLTNGSAGHDNNHHHHHHHHSKFAPSAANGDLLPQSSSSSSSSGGKRPIRQDSDLGPAGRKHPPPKPPGAMPTREESRSEIIKPAADESSTTHKRPGWLEELSRKQAVRKSGLFKEETKAEEKNGETTAATGGKVTSPTLESKPVVPAKPSQIKEDVRRSNLFGSPLKRPTSLDSPVSPTHPGPNNAASMSPVKHDVAPATFAAASTLPDESSWEMVDRVKKRPSTAAEVVDHGRRTPKEDLEMLSLIERVRRLEGLLVSVQDDYNARLNSLAEELREEREARKKVEAELSEANRRNQRW